MATERAHELQLTNAFLIAYRRPNVRLFRRNIINKTVRDLHTEQTYQLKSGIVGQADIYGYARRTEGLTGITKKVGLAVPLEIELKGVGTPLSQEQVNWETWCKDWGIVHMILRAKKGEMVTDTVSRWTGELDRFLAAAFVGALP